jgi:hypothetical protein
MRKKDTNKKKLHLNSETLRALELTEVVGGGNCTRAVSGCPDYSFVYTGCPGVPC